MQSFAIICKCRLRCRKICLCLIEDDLETRDNELRRLAKTGWAHPLAQKVKSIKIIQEHQNSNGKGWPRLKLHELSDDLRSVLELTLWSFQDLVWSEPRLVSFLSTVGLLFTVRPHTFKNIMNNSSAVVLHHAHTHTTHLIIGYHRAYHGVQQYTSYHLGTWCYSSTPSRWFAIHRHYLFLKRDWPSLIFETFIEHKWGSNMV